MQSMLLGQIFCEELHSGSCRGAAFLRATHFKVWPLGAGAAGGRTPLEGGGALDHVLLALVHHTVRIHLALRPPAARLGRPLPGGP